MVVENSLGDVVRLLAASISKHGRTIPFQDETPWHTVFFRLKNELPEPKPSFIADLEFDWDGPLPKSQDLSDFLQALHWTGSVAAYNPSYEQIVVPEGIKSIWMDELATLSPEMTGVLNRAVQLAVEEFPQSYSS